MQAYCVHTDEYDAGHEGLQNFEQAWHTGEKPTDFTRLGPSQSNLDSVEDEGQEGENAGRNRFATTSRSVEGGVEDGRCEHLDG